MAVLGVGEVPEDSDWNQILSTFKPIGYNTVSSIEVGLNEQEYNIEFTAYRASNESDAVYIIYGTEPFTGDASGQVTFIKNLTLKEIE